MSSTTVGKVLVFVNLIFSLVLLGWALAIVSTRVNYESPEYTVPGVRVRASETGGTFEVPPEKLKWDEFSTRWIGSGSGAAYRAEDRRRDARRELLAAENQRAFNRAFYANELAVLRTGQNLRGQKAAVQSLPAYQNYRNVETGRQALTLRGQPLMHIDSYGPRYDQLKNEIDVQHAEVVKRIKNVEKLTQAVGILRREIAHEELTLRNSQAEQEWLKTLAYSRADDVDQLELRNEELKSRLGELAPVKKNGQPGGGN